MQRLCSHLQKALRGSVVRMAIGCNEERTVTHTSGRGHQNSRGCLSQPLSALGLQSLAAFAQRLSLLSTLLDRHRSQVAFRGGGEARLGTSRPAVDPIRQVDPGVQLASQGRAESNRCMHLSMTRLGGNAVSIGSTTAKWQIVSGPLNRSLLNAATDSTLKRLVPPLMFKFVPTH